MRRLVFLSGNEYKVKEYESLFKELLRDERFSFDHLSMDLPEIQSFDGEEIIKEKLFTAREKNPSLADDILFIEDTSLYVDTLQGLPGPLIKWFLKAFGVKGLAEAIINKGGDDTVALAKTIIGLSVPGLGEFFFSGEHKGRVVLPRGNNGFVKGWDPIFEHMTGPFKGRTNSELSISDKNAISQRRKAFELMVDWLKKNL